MKVELSRAELRVLLDAIDAAYPRNYASKELFVGPTATAVDLVKLRSRISYQSMIAEEVEGRPPEVRVRLGRVGQRYEEALYHVVTLGEDLRADPVVALDEPLVVGQPAPRSVRKGEEVLVQFPAGCVPGPDELFPPRHWSLGDWQREVSRLLLELVEQANRSAGGGTPGWFELKFRSDLGPIRAVSSGALEHVSAGYVEKFTSREGQTARVEVKR